MPLDPQAQALLDEMREAGAKPFEELSVPEAREASWAFLDLAGEPQEVGSVRDRYIPGPHADIHVRIYTPAAGAGGSNGSAARPALVYFHGSGWVIANIDIADRATRSLANSTGCVVVSVNYQKAPEHKFPVPFDDCYAATTWVAANAAELGVDPARIGVAGDSAGGNIAAAACLKARDEDGPAIAYQLLIYPATDCDWDKPSTIENAEGYMLQRATMEWFWNHYVRSPSDAENPLVSPLRAADVSGLPPAFIVTAEFDPLRDDGELYADRLRDAGVPVKYTEYKGMIHGFYWMTGVLDQARRLHDEIAQEVRAAFGPVAV
jgi:acetyl esterase